MLLCGGGNGAEDVAIDKSAASRASPSSPWQVFARVELSMILYVILP